MPKQASPNIVKYGRIALRTINILLESFQIRLYALLVSFWYSENALKPYMAARSESNRIASEYIQNRP